MDSGEMAVIIRNTVQGLLEAAVFHSSDQYKKRADNHNLFCGLSALRLCVWLFNGLNFQIKHTFGRTHKTASTANACFHRAGVNQYSNLTFTHPKGNTIENRFAPKPCIGAYLPQYSEECSFSIYGE